MTTGARGGDGAPAPFTEEAIARGLVFSPVAAAGAGRGVGLLDIDGDRDPDAVGLGGPGGVLGVFENDGTGHFTDRSAITGLGPIANAVGLAAADYDLDGDLDLYVSCWPGANRLLRNDGAFKFSDVTTAAGVGDEGLGTGCTWGDVDGDGWPDLYVSNMTSSPSLPVNRLYRNLGNGAFEDVAAEQGADYDALTWGSVFLDYDRDGDADLYVSNDKGQAACDWHNYLLRNDGGTLVDVSAPSGADVCLDSMGVAVGDFDNNGWLDLYCTNTPFGHPLLMNQGDGTFVEASIAAGVASFETGWAAMFLDYDNDRKLELFVAQQSAPNRLYDDVDGWPCEDLAPDLGLAMGPFASSYCAAAGDVDGDGDLDLLVEQFGDRLHLFINHEGDQRNWLRLDVRGEGDDRFAIGAQVDVSISGQPPQTREVLSGTSFKSQNEMPLHFGVGDTTVIGRIQIHWPGGTSRMLSDYPANETWTIHAPDELGDATGDGVVGLADFPTFRSCAEAGAVAPGCEMMDLDGNAVVDADDFAAFVARYADPFVDCDGNGVFDLEEIILGGAADLNGDAVPDACQSPSDLDGDGAVGITDVLVVLAAWGNCPAPCPPTCAADLNEDCKVNVSELLLVLADWS